MDNQANILAINHDLPIRTNEPVHNGKVRSVYWLTEEDSKRLIKQHQYPVAENTPLAIMIISDRISAFDCIFQGEQGLKGVPGKGVALNTIAQYWFTRFQEANLADNHILDVPHPLVWIVQKARPIKIEAIIRQYITGSMWRAYEKGERLFCGNRLPEGLKQNQKLPKPIITPSTKGILKNIPNVPEQDDVNISEQDINNHFQAFGFEHINDVEQYKKLLTQGFTLISQELEKIDQLFVDTKFEFGYITNKQGKSQLIYMDEVGTPDSSRIWDKKAYLQGEIIENSKELFRKNLLNYVPDPNILLDNSRMVERQQLAKNTLLPTNIINEIATTYLKIAKKITHQEMNIPINPRAEIIKILNKKYGVVK